MVTLYETYQAQGKTLPSTVEGRFADPAFATAAKTAGIDQSAYKVDMNNAAANTKIADLYGKKVDVPVTDVKTDITTAPVKTPTFGINTGIAPVGETKNLTDTQNNSYLVDNNGQIISGPNNGEYQVGENIAKYPNAYKQITGMEIGGTKGEQLTTLNDNIASAAQTFATTVTNIQNGSIPLSDADNAQIEGLKVKYKEMIDKQILTNTSASGIANIRGYQKGAAEYDPSFQIGIINSIVSSGMSKVLDLQNKEASAVATLTQALKDNNIKNIKIAYDSLHTAQNEKAKSLKETIDAVNKEIAADKKAQEEEIGRATSEIINDISTSVEDKQKALAESSGHLSYSQITTFTNIIKKQQKEEAAAKKKAEDDYKKTHTDAIMGGRMSDAEAAIAAGADPIAVRKAFIEEFPTGSAKFDAYFKRIKESTATYPGATSTDREI